MKLNELKYTQGARGHKPKIVGRGHGSGMGKTSSRGQKGQKSRKSGHTRPGFEGGQTPLYRRIPKVGFNNYRFAKKYTELNLKNLVELNEMIIDKELLVKKELIKSTKEVVKVIGNIELTSPITLIVDKVTAGTRSSIEKSGGKIELIKA
jgi:large subunit ribosomal protein L15